ncbi:tRNA uridine-5-carboxymethylaminomethyl(34) synthesis enzyme MnmG [Candidatus Omnitrophota bacterium]
MNKYDVIVVGAGHAGIEAANAASKLGCSVLILTLSIDTIGKLSCNPAVGGVAKSHLVRETDALGGAISRLTDKTGLQYRILNKSKGKAVWATRVQVDRNAYNKEARDLIFNQENITVLEAEAENIVVRKNTVKAVVTNVGEFRASAVIVCAGTFLDGLIHIGLKHFPGGRLGEVPARALYQGLVEMGFTTKHFKTGTCARLDRRTLEFSGMTEQLSDKEAEPFSFLTGSKPKNEMSCYIAHTNIKTHRIIKNNLKYSPLYQGLIKAKGVRYCPSLEDKVVKFRDKQRHQIFIEPEARDSYEVYPNGISTSLPLDVQYKFIHSIEGLERARIIRPGYGIEHALIDARQLRATLEAKAFSGLYLAGQVNGTTGYEEAAAQGLIAGINAGLKIKKKEPLVLKREEAFIGVLIDDLTSKGTDEPYRMFTSRSEFRLLLREDNALLRLYKISYRLGLIGREDFLKVEQKQHRIKNEIDKLKKTVFYPNKKNNKVLLRMGTPGLSQVTAASLVLKRPQICYEDLGKLGYDKLLKDKDEIHQVEIETKYEGFIKRQLIQAQELKKLDRIKIPRDISYNKIPGLSREIQEKLKNVGPVTLREAQDISGVTPAAILILLRFLKTTPAKCKRTPIRV